MKKLTYSFLAVAFAATGVHAQDSGALPQTDATAPAAPEATLPAEQTEALPSTAPDATQPVPATQAPAAPTADAGTVASATVTDAEVESFAKAMAEVQDIQADAALDAQTKQTQMAAAVTEAGLEPARFNEIGQAVGTDGDLRARIQTAMAAHAAAEQG